MPKTGKFNAISEKMKKLAQEVDIQREHLAEEFQELQEANAENFKEMADAQEKFDQALQKVNKLQEEIGADSEILTVADARKAMNQAEDGLPFIKARANYKQAVENEKQDKDMLSLVDSDIMPVIDELIDKHKDGSDISIKEIEKGVSKILFSLSKKGLIPTGEKLNYLHLENEHGQTAFMQDLQTSLNLKDGEQTLKAPNIKSAKDKLLNFVSKMCTSIGQPQLVKHCRKHMSKEAQAQFKSSEGKLASLVSSALTNIKKPKKPKHVNKLKEQVSNRATNRSNGSSR